MTAARVVRVCKSHGQVLDDLTCPVGPHQVENWLVVDRAKDQALYDCDQDLAMATEVNRKLEAKAGPPARTRPAPRPERRREPMEERERTAPPEKKRQQFTGPAGRLVITLTRGRNGKHRVAWALKPTAGKKQSGLLHEGEDRAQALEAWNRELKEAAAQGWTDHSAYTPIPSAALVGQPAKPQVRAIVKPANGRACGKCGAQGHNARTCGKKGARRAA